MADTNYSESFTAIPRDGWQFVKWTLGTNFLCGNSTNPTCDVSNVGAAGNANLEALVASNKTFYIMPIFKLTSSAEPIKFTVTVAGKEWAQPNLFLNVKRSEMNTACPDGACSGTLNGFDMNGWTWASADDLNALFNRYIGSEQLGPGPDVQFLPYIEWHNIFWGDGWWFNDTVNSHLAIAGFTRGCSPHPETGVLHPDVARIWVGSSFNPSTELPWSLESFVSTIGPFYSDGGDCNTVRLTYPRPGGWFYRPAP